MARRFLISLLVIYSTVFNTTAQLDKETVAKINCTHDGFLPHPTNCKAFYWCSMRRNLRAIILECDDMQIFDTSTQTCTYPWLSTRKECGGTFHLTNEVEAGETSHRKTEFNCVKQGYYPDENDCAKFYHCIGKGRGLFNKYEFTCKQGTVWDPVTSGCNYPWATSNVKCNGRIGTNVPLSTSNKPSPRYQFYPGLNPGKLEQNSVQQPIINKGYNVPEEKASVSSAASSPEEELVTNIRNNRQSKDECIEEGFIPDSKDCAMFYRCVSNGRSGFIKYEFTCGKGTVWDPETNTCNHPSNTRGECGTGGNLDNFNNNIYKPDLDPDNPNPNNPNSDNISLKPITDSSNYPQPSSTVKPLQEINEPITTTTSNELSSTASSPDDSQNSSSNVSDSDKKLFDVCTQQGFIGDSKDCKKFFRCVQNGKNGFTKHEFKCGEGTIWDLEKSTCNYPSATRRQCGDSSTGQEIEEITTVKPDDHDNNNDNEVTNQATTESTANVDSHKDNNQDSNHHNSTLSTTPLPTPNKDTDDSSCTQDGFMSDSVDCKIFYRCVKSNRGFTKYEFTCGEGTVWDSDLHTCNHPSAVRNNKCGIANNSETPQTDHSIEPTESSTSEKTQESTTETQDNPTTKETSPGLTTTEKHIPAVTESVSSTRESESGSDSSVVVSTEPNQPQVSTTQATSTYKPTSQSQTEHGSFSSEQPSTEISEPGLSSESSTPSTSNQSQTEPIPLSTPKQDISIEKQDDDCKEEGFMADSEDCQKFYRCVGFVNRGFTKYEFVCAEGTVWDSDLNTCNYPSAVRNSKCGSAYIPETTETALTTRFGSSTSEKPSTTTRTSESTTVVSTEPHQPEISTTPSSSKPTSQTQTEHGSFSTEQPSKTTGINESESSSESSIVLSTEPNQPEVSTTQTLSSSSQSQTESEPSSTPKQDIDNNVEKQDDDCKEEGFMADSEDCQKFYRCVGFVNRGFTKYEFVCGEGTVWDSDLNTCNHPSAVRNSKCGSTHIPETTETTLTTRFESSNTNESIATETESESTSEKLSTTTRTSESTTVVSTEPHQPEISTIQTPSSSEPTNTSQTEHGSFSTEQPSRTTRISESGSSSESSTVLSTGPNQPEVSTTITLSTSSQSQTELVPSSTPKQDIDNSTEKQDDNCKEEGFMADSEDCQKFYRCVGFVNRGFTKYEFVCGEGTVWDSDLNTCNHPSAVRNSKCGSAYIPETTETALTTRLESSNTDQPISTVTESESSTRTSESTTVVSTELHQPEISTTPSPSESTTSQPEHGSSSTEQPSTTTGINESESSSESSTVSSTEPNQPEVSTTQILSTTSQSQTEPSSTSKQEISTTQTPLSSEPTSQSQTEPTTITESSEPGLSSESTTILSTEFQQPEVSTTHAPSTSQPPTESSTTTGPNKPESASTVVSTEPNLPSTSAQITRPPKIQPIGSICKEEGFFPNMEDCNKFYRCVSFNGGFTKYDFNCGPGTIWDPDLTTCNYPYAVRNKKCKEASQQTTKKPETSSTSTEKLPEITQTEKPETPPENENQHECTGEGFYPNNQDCKKFIRCVDNGYGGYIKYDFECATGTIFDTNIKTCNHYYAAENRACGHSIGVQPTTDKDIKTDEPTTSIEIITSTEDIPTTTVTEESTTEVDKEIIATTPLQETTTEIELETTTISELEKEINATTPSQETTTEIIPQTTNEQSSTEVETEINSTTPSSETTTETTSSQEITTEIELQTTTISEQSTTEVETEINSTTPSPETTPEIELQTTTISEQSTTEVETEINSTTPSSETTTEIELQTTTISEQSTTEVEKEISSTIPSTETTTETTSSPETTTDFELQTTTISEQGTTEVEKEIGSTTLSQEITTDTTSYQETTTVLTTTETEQGTTLLPTTTEGTTDETIKEETSTVSVELTTTEPNPETTTNESQSTTIDEGQLANQTVNCPVAELEGDQISLVCPTGFKRHPKYCNLFYQCTNDPDTSEIKILVLSCPSGTVFDDKKIQCLAPTKGTEKCTKDQFKQRIGRSSLPVVISSRKPLCPMEGTHPLDPLINSNKFIKCERAPTDKRTMRAYIHQCPEDFVYWPTSKSCESVSIMRVLGAVEEEDKFNEEQTFMIPVEIKIDVRKPFKK